MIDSVDTQKYYSLWMTMVRTKDAIHRVREKELHQCQISPEQSGILGYVMELDNNAIPADICRLSFRKANTISITLDRMAKKGLIHRGKDKKRRNIIRVSLTEKGKDIYYQTTLRRSIQEIFSALSDQECQQLESCFGILLNKTTRLL